MKILTLSLPTALILGLSLQVVHADIIYSEDFESMPVDTVLPENKGIIRSFADYTKKENREVMVVDHGGNQMLRITDTDAGWTGTKTIRLRDSANDPVRTFTFKFIESEGDYDGPMVIMFGTWLSKETIIAFWQLEDGKVFGKPRYKEGELTVADIILNNTDQEVSLPDGTLPAHSHTLYINGERVGRPQELKLVEDLPSGTPIENFYFRTYSDSKQQFLVDDIEVRNGVNVSGKP